MAVSLIGDFNGDGVVNLSDHTLFVAAFGLSEGDVGVPVGINQMDAHDRFTYSLAGSLIGGAASLGCSRWWKTRQWKKSGQPFLSAPSLALQLCPKFSENRQRFVVFPSVCSPVLKAESPLLPHFGFELSYR